MMLSIVEFSGFGKRKGTATTTVFLFFRHRPNPYSRIHRRVTGIGVFSFSGLLTSSMLEEVGCRRMVCTYMTQKIGDVAKQLNLTVPTIRYYEEIGQLQIARKNKVREFTPQDIQLLHAIREWKELGFSLNELREIAALEKNGLGCKDMQLNRVKEVLSRKKLEDLKRLREQTNRQIA